MTPSDELRGVRKSCYRWEDSAHEDPGPAHSCAPRRALVDATVARFATGTQVPKVTAVPWAVATRAISTGSIRRRRTPNGTLDAPPRAAAGPCERDPLAPAAGPHETAVQTRNRGVLSE